MDINQPAQIEWDRAPCFMAHRLHKKGMGLIVSSWTFDIPGLVNVYKKLWKIPIFNGQITIFNGKIHYKMEQSLFLMGKSPFLMGKSTITMENHYV